MKPEINKYYQLNLNKFYFSINLQRLVKFSDILLVKFTNTINENINIGKLVDVRFIGDYELDTENEIEFCNEDIVSEHKPKDIFCPYMDYKFIGQGHGKIIAGKTSPEIEFAYG